MTGVCTKHEANSCRALMMMMSTTVGLLLRVVTYSFLPITIDILLLQNITIVVSYCFNTMSKPISFAETHKDFVLKLKFVGDDGKE